MIFYSEIIFFLGRFCAKIQNPTYNLLAHFVLYKRTFRFGDYTFATKDTMVAADFVGIVSAKNDPDKMGKTGWTAVQSENVNAPIFTDFPMTLECRIKYKIDESEEGYYIVADVINVLVDEKYLTEEGKPNVAKMQLITYEPVTHSYVALGDKVGNAFCAGKALK